MELYDFAVIGSGIAGLYVADTLSSFGAKVVVLDRHRTIGAEASTRNGGYVHAGGFHSATLLDDAEAHQTARDCIAGAERLRSRFPEARIEAGGDIHLLFRTEERLLAAQSRWFTSGVVANVVGKKFLQKRYPNLDTGAVGGAAAVEDFPINTRIVLMKLFVNAKRNKVEFRLGSEQIETSGGIVSFHRDSERHVLQCEKVIFCTGAGTHPSIVKKLCNVNRFISIWKSHVLVAPEMDGIGFMFVDSGDVSVTPQDGYSVVCTRGDELKIDQVNRDLDISTIEKNFSALCRAVPSMLRFRSEIRPHCCLKLSLDKQPDEVRNVSCRIVVLNEFEIFAAPGKFTTAPILADLVLRSVASSEFGSSIALRPGDVPSFTRSLEAAAT